MHAAVVSFGDTFQNVFQLPGLRLFCISNPCYTKWRWHLERKYFITVTLVFILPQRLQFSSTANASPDEPCSRVFKPYCVCPNIGHGHGQPKASDRFFLPFNGCGPILEASSETREPPASAGHETHVSNMYAADDGARSSFPAGVNMFLKQARIREEYRGQVL